MCVVVFFFYKLKLELLTQGGAQHRRRLCSQSSSASSQELLSLTTREGSLKKVMKDSLVNREIKLPLTFQLKVTLLVKKIFLNNKNNIKSSQTASFLNENGLKVLQRVEGKRRARKETKQNRTQLASAATTFMNHFFWSSS